MKVNGKIHTTVLTARTESRLIRDSIWWAMRREAGGLSKIWNSVQLLSVNPFSIWLDTLLHTDTNSKIGFLPHQTPPLLTLWQQRRRRISLCERRRKTRPCYYEVGCCFTFCFITPLYLTQKAQATFPLNQVRATLWLIFHRATSRITPPLPVLK